MHIDQRYLTQYLIKHGAISPEQALKHCEGIPGAPIRDITQLKNTVLAINRDISRQGFKLVWKFCEVTKQELLIWTNTKRDDIALHQLSFTPIELQYFHTIMEEILSDESHRLPYPAVLNLTSGLTSQFSRDSGQKAFQSWVANGYFVQLDDYVYLGPRLIVEFTTYLKSKFPEQTCKLCSELVFTGKSCSLCHKLLHNYCLDKYLARENKCPSCRKAWVEQTDEADDWNGSSE
ncbi:non-structural maintenance of chromosomes element 1 homolog [Dendroctonus ponderosae]